jgi:hypothetical protein
LEPKPYHTCVFGLSYRTPACTCNLIHKRGCLIYRLRIMFEGQRELNLDPNSNVKVVVFIFQGIILCLVNDLWAEIKAEYVSRYVY